MKTNTTTAEIVEWTKQAKKAKWTTAEHAALKFFADVLQEPPETIERRILKIALASPRTLLLEIISQIEYMEAEGLWMTTQGIERMADARIAAQSKYQKHLRRLRKV